MNPIYLLTIALFLNYASLSAQTDVITGLSYPDGLAISGDTLYISEYTGSRISKVDLTAETPTRTNLITELGGPAGLVFNGDELYVAEYSGNKISKIDITADSPTATTVATGVAKPWHLLIDNNILYIAEYSFSGKVSKLDLATLSLSELYVGSTATYVSPNPADEFIQVFDHVKGKEAYSIYNVLGAEIATGSISDKQKIDISKFTNGIYFLKLQNGKSLKFIKE